MPSATAALYCSRPACGVLPSRQVQALSALERHQTKPVQPNGLQDSTRRPQRGSQDSGDPVLNYFNTVEELIEAIRERPAENYTVDRYPNRDVSYKMRQCTVGH